jgi:hypothetical protein
VRTKVIENIKHNIQSVPYLVELSPLRETVGCHGNQFLKETPKHQINEGL